MDDTFPRIQRLAEKIGADIAFEDESGVDLQTHSGKNWGEVGKTPEISVTGKRGGYNILSAVMETGQMYFSVKDGNITSEEYIVFLKALLRRRTNPLILIADHAPFHSSKEGT